MCIRKKILLVNSHSKVIHKENNVCIFALNNFQLRGCCKVREDNSTTPATRIMVGKKEKISFYSVVNEELSLVGKASACLKHQEL